MVDEDCDGAGCEAKDGRIDCLDGGYGGGDGAVDGEVLVKGDDYEEDLQEFGVIGRQSNFSNKRIINS